MSDALRIGGVVVAAVVAVWGLFKLRVYLDVGAGHDQPVPANVIEPVTAPPRDSDTSTWPVEAT